MKRPVSITRETTYTIECECGNVFEESDAGGIGLGAAICPACGETLILKGISIQEDGE